jgi:hypothetical protein
MIYGNQFKTLTVGDCVVGKTSTSDLVGIAWSGVSIDWDDGHSTSIQRNDMARVEKVK